MTNTNAKPKAAAAARKPSAAAYKAAGDANAAARTWLTTPRALRQICSRHAFNALSAAWEKLPKKDAKGRRRLLQCIEAVLKAREAIENGGILAAGGTVEGKPVDAYAAELGGEGEGAAVLVFRYKGELDGSQETVVFASPLLHALDNTPVNRAGLSAAAVVHQTFLRLKALTGASAELTVRPRNAMPRMRVEVLDRITEADMPIIGVEPEPEPQQFALFDGGRPGGGGVRPLRGAWFLDLWEASGITTRGPGGSTPLGIRLRDQILLRIPPKHWDGRSHDMDMDRALTLQVIGRWLSPSGGGWHKNILKRWPTTRDQLMMAEKRIPIVCGGISYRWPLLVLTIPEELKVDERRKLTWADPLPVGISYRIPPTATKAGMPVNGERLRALGGKSLLYRVYLLGCFLADKHGKDGYSKSRQLADGRPNPFVVRGALGDIPSRRSAEYVRVVPWDVMLRTVFGRVSEQPAKDREKVEEALHKLRDGAGLPPGVGDRTGGIDFDIVGDRGVQIFGDPQNLNRPAPPDAEAEDRWRWAEARTAAVLANLTVSAVMSAVEQAEALQKPDGKPFTPAECLRTAAAALGVQTVRSANGTPITPAKTLKSWCRRKENRRYFPRGA